MSLTKLATFDNSISANILRTKLESEGIVCFLHNEHFTNLMPHYFNILGSGVQVFVPTNQIERAKEIAKLDPTQLICPNCSSSNVVNSTSMSKLSLIFIALLVFLPFGNLLNNFSCKECGHKFKSINPSGR